MIKELFSVMHPTFHALSAYADLSDVDGARTSVGRHVKRCAECSGVVEEIRALGASAREETDESAPEGLWARIERAANAPNETASPRETLPPDAKPWDAAPSLRPTKHWPVPLPTSSRRLWVGIAVAAAAAIVAVLAWPADRSLQASAPSRVTFSPGRPVPGGMMTVRYRPARWFRGAPRLVLVGRWLKPATMVSSRRMPTLGDSIGALLPTSDGNYEARVLLPDDFLGVHMGVSDSAGTDADADGYRLWLAIGGARDGKPSLNSLLASVDDSYHLMRADAALQPRQNVNASDSLKKYFPSYPAGWAYSRELSGKGSRIDRLISFFRSGEKKYLAFHEELWPKKNLDAERMHEMVVLANTISEPGEVNRWARRFAVEHPEDPRAFSDLIDALHQVELTEPPALADSIRPWLPVLERLFTKSALTAADGYTLYALASRYGDSATADAWMRRLAEATGSIYWHKAYGTNAQMRSAATARWEEIVAAPCVRVNGKFILNATFGDPLVQCQRQRVWTFANLSRAKLLDRDALAARRYADSAQTAQHASGWCGFYGDYISGVAASLMLGDTTAALRYLVTPAVYWPRWDNAGRDSAQRWLGARLDSPSFKAAVDSARVVVRSCDSSRKAAAEEREKRFRRTAE